MKKVHILFFSLLTGISGLVSAQESDIVPGNLLIMLNSDAAADQLTKDLCFLGGVKTGLYPARVLSKSMNIYLFDFNANAIHQDRILTAVSNSPLVKIAQFNHSIKERTTPSDSQFVSMWNMNNTGQGGGTVDADIDAPEAWSITTGGLTSQGDTIVVAIVDGGFDLGQEDLNFWKNYQEIPNNTIDDDNNGYVDDYDGWNGGTANDNIPSLSHGTHVTGIVGARGNNCIGVTGVNWYVKLMPLSYGSGGGALESGAIASYSYIRDQRRLYNQTNGAKGAFIVSTNSSFGIDAEPASAHPLWCAMYDSLGAVGILSAAATSNSNNDVDAVGDMPTACSSNWLITVTNTNQNDVKATAGYGATTIDIGAPGTGITSTYPANSYSLLSGTSMSSPHIAGAVGLMYSVICSHFIADYKADPAGIALMVKDSLLNGVDPIASLNGKTVSGGRLNLYNAVHSIENYCFQTDPTDTIITINSILDTCSTNSIPEIIIPRSTSISTEIKYVSLDASINSLKIVYSCAQKSEISMVNVLGQKIKNIEVYGSESEQSTQVELNSIGKGIYFVSIRSNNTKSNVVKVMVY